MSNLTPQKRMDKTGKLVTRHVRTDPKSGMSTALPAPVIGKQVKKPLKKPLAKQLKPQSYWLNADQYDWNHDLHRALKLENHGYVIMTANEVQVYDVMSVVETDNAIALLNGGIKSAEEAESFLHEHGLEHLIIDRREMTDKAIERRISSYHFIDMKHKYGNLAMDADSKIFLDAARLSDTLTLDKFTNSFTKEETSFPEEVLKGTIDYDDLMGISLTVLKDNKYYLPSVFECLEAMKRGETERDIEGLKELLTERVRGSYTLLDSMKLRSQLGKDFISTIHNLDQAHGINRQFPDLPLSEKKGLISYADEGMVAFHKISLDSIAKLYKGSVPIDKAKEMMSAGMEIDQIVGAYQNEVSPAVSTGWL